MMNLALKVEHARGEKTEWQLARLLPLLRMAMISGATNRKQLTKPAETTMSPLPHQHMVVLQCRGEAAALVQNLRPVHPGQQYRQAVEMSPVQLPRQLQTAVKFSFALVWAARC